MPLRVNPFKKTCVTLNAFFSVSLTVRAICEVICILQIARPLGGKPGGISTQLLYTPHKTALIRHDLVGLSQLV